MRQLLRGTAWQGPSVAPLVPRLAGEQTERVPLGKPLNLTERAKRLFGFGKVGPKFIRRVTSPTERIIPSMVRLAGSRVDA